MKKRSMFLLAIAMTLCLIFGSTFCLTSCSDAGEPETANETPSDSEKDPGADQTGTQENEKEPEDEGGDEVPAPELEPDTPQSFIDLFTFDNVTIVLKNTLTIKRGDEYRCVNGQWYYKYQGAETFEAHSGRNIFDFYLCHYSAFTYDEPASCYRASGVDMDGSGYLHEITISLSEGKITNITDTASNGALTIVTTIDFSAYGETAIG